VNSERKAIEKERLVAIKNKMAKQQSAYAEGLQENWVDPKTEDWGDKESCNHKILYNN